MISMTSKTMKTILFAGLLAAMILPFMFSNVSAQNCENYLRDNGKTICVSDATAQKLADRGWNLTKIVEEIVDFITLPEETETIESPQVIVTPTNTPAGIVVIEKEMGWLKGETDLSYMQLEKIPNESGFWVPITEKDEFANLLVNTTGDTIVNKIILGDSNKYITEKGEIKIRHHALMVDRLAGSVEYNYNQSISDDSKRLEFINNFMTSMGLEFDGNSISKQASMNYVIYRVFNELNVIEFQFHYGTYAQYGVSGISIFFDGWTNNPELVNYTINQKDAVQIAYDFAATNQKLNSKDGTCLFESNNDSFRKVIIAGVPFFSVDVGDCTYDPRGTGHYRTPEILVDANTGSFTSVIEVSHE